MKPSHPYFLFVGLAIMLAITLAACGKDDKEVTKSGETGIARFKLAAEPLGVKDVVVVKNEAKVGDEVVVFGRLRKFGDGYASFILTGQAMKHCAERETDTCQTPWDYCCESPTDLAAHSLNVEFRNGERPFKKNINGIGGLKLLADVVVKGKVAEIRDGNVTVSAEGFFVRP
jgi:hypothetical protein